MEVVVDPQRQIDHFDLDLGLSNGLFRYWTQYPYIFESNHKLGDL